ncbi:MAG: hypothetical protein V1834_01640 [Candidatus Micrarchaeota archaeon]
MKFVFRTRADYAEVPAAVAARKVAEILRERGHDVRVIPFPRKLSFLTLLEKPEIAGDRKKLARFMVARTREHFSRHKLGDRETHVIDFHNSQPQSFFTVRKKKLHEYPAAVKSDEVVGLPSPVTFILDPEEERKGRLIATLELPAEQDQLRGGKFRGMTRKARDTVEKQDLGGEATDMLIDFFRKHEDFTYFSTRKTRGTGFLSPEFLEKVADDIERLAKKGTVKPEEESTAERLSRSIAFNVRSNPLLLDPEEFEKKRAAAQKEHAEFVREYGANAGRLFEEDREKLAKLNLEKMKREAAMLEWDYWGMILEEMKKNSARLGKTIREVYGIYGKLPHFARGK